MATMDPGQRGFGQQRQFNIPDLPFGTPTPGNVPYFDRIKRLLPGGRIPPELLQMLMAQLMGGQGAPGGGSRSPMGGVGQRQAMQAAQRGGQRPPMGGGRPPSGRPPMGGGGRPPMGGGRPPQRPPMGRGRPPMRGGPRGGGRPPVIKIEDLVRAISGRGGRQRPPQQADMAIPQAPR